MGLAFQGFYERDRGTGEVTGFPHQYVNARTDPKPSAVRLEECPDFYPWQISVPQERGRFTQPMLLPRGLANP